ncbi:MAG: phosphatase PAP2 family protein [Alphaproteobacteria bacterium]|nr:phosphatase PAP2 family protein [Alphaproteobacteria bacterium]MBU0858941.1 phosphatase PAP2 family protein [Alphaproteobacteria bacterium]
MNEWIKELKLSLRSGLFLFLAAVVALYVGTAYFVTAMHDWPVAVHLQMYSGAMRYGTLWFVLGFIAYRSFYIMIFQRPHYLTLTILKDLRDNYFTPRRLMHGIPIIILFAMTFSVFTSFKSMIPLINPFQFDPLFAQIDKTLHFGRHPWEWMFPVLKIALFTTALSFIYKTWFVAKFCVLYWQAFSTTNMKLRAQFFMTYMLIWIINGTVLATLLSSAGPCFYAQATGLADNPYAPLMAFLNETDKILPVWDLYAHTYLWEAHLDEGIKRFAGISAMPSMHISLAFLFVLVAWKTNRKAGWFFTAYLVLMMMGSVHLAWHYAIDGYFGIIMTYAIWRAVGWVQARCAKGVTITDNNAVKDSP